MGLAYTNEDLERRIATLERELAAANRIIDSNNEFIQALGITCQNAEKEAIALRDAKDGAYLERNQCVAALSKLFPATVSRTAIEGWSEDWHGCVYIDLPSGQVSWHFHDSHAHLFAHLPYGIVKWDGHDTPEKYRRLGAIDAEYGQALREDAERLNWLFENGCGVRHKYNARRNLVCWIDDGRSDIDRKMREEIAARLPSAPARIATIDADGLPIAPPEK